MYIKTLMDNPLKTHNDVATALLEMLKPLETSFSQHGLKYGSGTAQHGDFIGEIEAIARPLWGISPLLAGGGDYSCFEKYLAKIIQGVDPASPSYWGILPYKDQRVVEMAAIAVGMITAKKHYWDALTRPQQDNLYNWLDQINDHEIHTSNWLFFRVLANTAFKLCGWEHNQTRMDRDLEIIDSMYISNGWYCDGFKTQIDYYIPFAIHFYGLIYAKYADFDPKYPKLFKERAVEFAKTFPAFFADSGEAVPFGRSMAYRFAQSAFFGALALADVEALPWGVTKRLALQNLRYWMKQDMFTDNGELSVGYYYPNQVMSEGYNAYGSPYWALKAFIMLAVPESHPFWTADEETPELKTHIPLPEARGIIQRDATQSQFYVVGQYVSSWMSHAQAKYEKFVYSSYFGFSVPKSAIGLAQGAFDNTLAVCEDDNFYRMRYGAEEYKVYDDYLYAKWKPWDDVVIESYILPLFPWHVRVHMVSTGRKLALADGGFAVDRQGEYKKVADEKSCAVIRKGCVSAIAGLAGWQKPLAVQTEPATNLMVPLTLIPTMTAKVAPGDYVFASAVLGAVGENAQDYLDTPPAVTVSDSEAVVRHLGMQKAIRFEK